MKTAQTLLATVVLFAVTGANATLVPALGGQVVNDTDLNVTWLADANLAATEHFGVTSGIQLNGSMDWVTAKAWIAGMNAYNSGAGYLGYSDWRLPSTNSVNGIAFNYGMSFDGSTDFGYNLSEQGTPYAGSTRSEMAHLYYNSLDNKGVYSTNPYVAQTEAWGLLNKFPFTNLLPANYWSGTEAAPDASSVQAGDAWNFSFWGGVQSNAPKEAGAFALAVRSGPVAAVPVPGAAWLLGSGLLGLIGVARRRL